MLNMEDNIWKTIATDIETSLGVSKETLKPDQKIEEDLGADSLDKIELIMEIEEDFGIMITEEDGDSITTLQDLHDCVKRLVEGKK